jgi:hypothetical protein
MKIRTTIGMAVLVAHALAGAAFPGGPVRCDKGNGVVKIEPAHAPHTRSCCPAPAEAPSPELSHRDRDHGGCTDTDAAAPYAPAAAFKMRSPAVVSILTAAEIGSDAPAAGPAPRPHDLSPPVALHISTTVLRA